MVITATEHPVPVAKRRSAAPEPSNAPNGRSARIVRCPACHAAFRISAASRASSFSCGRCGHTVTLRRAQAARHDAHRGPRADVATLHAHIRGIRMQRAMARTPRWSAAKLWRLAIATVAIASLAVALCLAA